MSLSGVKVNDECKTVFEGMKLRSTYRYLLFGFQDEKMDEIVILKRAEPSATYEQFCAELQTAADNKEARFAVFDYSYEAKDGQKKSKIVFFSWVTSDIKLKQKMVYASSKDYLLRALGTGIQLNVQACDFADLNCASIEAELRTKDR